MCSKGFSWRSIPSSCPGLTCRSCTSSSKGVNNVSDFGSSPCMNNFGSNISAVLKWVNAREACECTSAKIHFVPIEFQRENSYWLRKTHLLSKGLYLWSVTKELLPLFLSHLFNNLCSFCVLHNEGGNNYMCLCWQWVLLFLFQMETAAHSPANIYLCYTSFSSLSACSQEKVRKWKGCYCSFRYLFMNWTFLDTLNWVGVVLGFFFFGERTF